MERDALSPASAQHALPSTGPQPDRAREYAALACMADAIYCVDTTGHVTFVNTAFEAMSGYALADLRGTPSTRLYVPEAEALFLERRRHVYSGATVPPSLETVLLLKDGRRLPVELSVSNLIIDGQTAGRVGVVRDLTARQQTEQALRQSEAEARLLLQLHQTIMANMGEGVYTLDAQGRVTYMNPEAERLLGWKTEELLGRRMHDVTHYQRPDGSPFPLEECAGFQVLREGKALKDVEDTFIRKDASFFPVSYSSSLLRDANGQVVGLVVVFQDITERKRAEEALREREARYEFVVAGAEAAIWDWDVPRKRVVFSPRWKELRGLSDDDVRDGEDEWSSRIHPDDVERVMAAVRAHFEGRTPVFAEEYRVRHKDGHWVWILDRGLARRDAAGQVIRMAGSETDITERKQAEEALARWQHVIHQAGWAVAIANPADNTLQAVNPAFAAMHGYAVEELVGKPLANTFAPESRSEVPQQVQAAHQKGDHVYESTHIRKDGTRFPCLTHVTAFKDGSGRVVYRAATFQDLTDIRAAEQALRESEHRLRLALEAGRMGTWEWRLATNEVLWSPGLEALHGLAPGTFPGTFAAYQNDMHPDDRERVLRALAQTVEQGEDHHIEYRIVLPSGGIRWVEGRGKLFQEASGVPSSMIGVCMDITDRKQAEQALRESEARLRAVIETAVDGMITIDTRGQVDSINPAAVRLFGYAPQEVIGRNITLLMPEPYQSEHDIYLDDYLKTGTKRIIGSGREVVGRRKDGSTFPMDLAVSETTLDNRRLFTGIVRDISRRKAAEEALRVRARQQQAVAKLGELALRESQLQAVFEHAVAMVAETLEVDYGKVLELLPEGKELRLRAGVGWQEGLVGTATVGTDRDSQAGYTLLSDAPVVVEDLRQETRFSSPPLLTDHGVISGMSHVIRGTDGRPWGELGIHSTRRLSFTPDDVHFLAAVANILSDAIAREQAEAALRESEDRFRVLADSAPAAIWMSGVDKLCTHFNKGWLDFTGRTMEQELGNGWAEGVHPDDFERCLHTYLTAFDTRQEFEMEYRLRRYDGEYRWIVNIGVPRYLPSGEFVGYIGSCIDTTERKRAEDQLRQVQKMEALDTLAGGIAHEFNNILMAILGFTQLATSQVPPASAVSQYLQQVHTAGLRAKELVQQVLTFSRPYDHRREPVALSGVIQDALKFLRASLPTTIEMRQHIAPETGTVLANVNQLHQVLMNLCANAEYAMRETGGILEVGVDAVAIDAAGAASPPALPPGWYVRVWVRDTGAGIPGDVVERVFEPFFTTKGIGEGTGMGLAIVHGIVTSHGGAITVDSTLGEGTTFTLYLPQIAQDAAPPSAPPAPVVPPGKARLLLVDDEEMLACLGQALLERLGYEVAAYSSSLAALEAFQAEPCRFDLVITDQTMPVMSGATLVAELRHIRPDIPIILCTGFSHLMNAEKAEALGVDAFVLKPGMTQELAATIQRVLENRAHQGR